MNIVKYDLLNSLRNSSLIHFPSILKKCIYQGLISSDDLKLYSDKTYQFLDNFTLSQTTSVLHSFSIPNYRNFHLFTTLCNRIRILLDSEPLSVNDSIKIINSCSRLHYSDSQLFPFLLDVIKNNLDCIKTKHIVSILHSLTKLRFNDYELLSQFSKVALDGLDEISDISLANFSIAASKIYTIENTQNGQLNDTGRYIYSLLLPKIKTRCCVSSPLDNLRHVIALSNLKHLATNEDELKECLDILFKFINCSVLYHQHLVLLLECMFSLNYTNQSFILNSLVPNLLNKRNERNSTFELDLRLLKCMSAIPNPSRSCDFLIDQILQDLSKNLPRKPKLIKHTFSLINSVDANPDPFLSNIQESLEKSNIKLDDSIDEIRASIQRSSQNWANLRPLIEPSM